MKNKETMPFIEQLLNGENVEWKKLGEVCKVLRGSRLTKKELVETGKYPVFHGGRPLQNSLFKICSFHHIFVPL